MSKVIQQIHDDYYSTIIKEEKKDDYVTIKIKKKGSDDIRVIKTKQLQVKKITKKVTYINKKITSNKLLKATLKRISFIIPEVMKTQKQIINYQRISRIESTQGKINNYLSGKTTLKEFFWEISNNHLLRDCFKLRLGKWYDFDKQIYLKLNKLENEANKILWINSGTFKKKFEILQKIYIKARSIKKRKSSRSWIKSLQNWIHWYK